MVSVYLNKCIHWPVPCADPEGGGEVRWSGPPPPPPPLERSQKYRISYQDWAGSLKFSKFSNYEASVERWAIIGTPAKRHFRWRADESPLLVIFGSSLPLLKRQKTLQSWTPSDKTFWIRAWVLIRSVVTRLIGWPKIVFQILRDRAKTKDSCASTMQSLSLSESLSLRPAIKVCEPARLKNCWRTFHYNMRKDSDESVQMCIHYSKLGSR